MSTLLNFFRPMGVELGMRHARMAGPRNKGVTRHPLAGSVMYLRRGETENSVYNIDGKTEATRLGTLKDKPHVGEDSRTFY